MLPPLPAPDLNHWSPTPFSPPGLETVDALRPAREPYTNSDPNAPALVLIPGLSMDSGGYGRQLPLGAVADVHTLQAVNQPVPNEEGFGHFARHVEEYILHRKLHERPGGFVLGGSSMGGAVSIAICARGRVKPRGLVLIGSFANCKHLPGWQRFLAPLSWVIPFDFGKRCLRMTRRFLKNVRNPRLKNLYLMGQEDRIRHTFGYYGRAIMALTRQNQLDAARQFALPTLVIHGTRDRVLPHAAGVEMAESIPGAKFVSVEGAGHILFFTHAERVNAEIAEFIQRLPAR